MVQLRVGAIFRSSFAADKWVPRIKRGMTVEAFAVANALRTAGAPDR
jgi:hypothetical protein